MKLVAVLRSYGGENDKGRPPWLSKDLALASFPRAVRTAQAAGADVVPFRFMLNRRARAQKTPHLLYAITPRRATHAEKVQIPVGEGELDWDAEEAAVERWAAEQGIPTSQDSEAAAG